MLIFVNTIFQPSMVIICPPKVLIESTKVEVDVEKTRFGVGNCRERLSFKFSSCIFPLDKKVVKLENLKSSKHCSSAVEAQSSADLDSLYAQMHWCRPLQSARFWEPGSKTTKAMKNQQEPELGSFGCSHNPLLAPTERFRELWQALMFFLAGSHGAFFGRLSWCFFWQALLVRNLWYCYWEEKLMKWR